MMLISKRHTINMISDESLTLGFGRFSQCPNEVLVEGYEKETQNMMKASNASALAN